MKAMRNMMLSVLWFLMAIPSSQANEITEIGHVVMSVGEASHQKDDTVRLGDVLQTGDGATLMVVFNDDAKLVLRPNSRLTIENYLYLPQDASQNRVKYQVEYGTVRSITGKSGQENKAGFRMNTPIAAIGVRGTDFITQATSDSIKVAVLSGGVSVAPFGLHCIPATYGACEVENKVEAIANSKLNAVEMIRRAQGVEIRQIDWLPEALKQFQAKQGDHAGAKSDTNNASNALVQQVSSDQQATTSMMQANIKTDPVYWGRWQHIVSNDPELATASGLIDAKYRPVAANDVFGLFVSPDFLQGKLPTSGKVQLSPNYAKVYVQRGEQLTTGIFDSGVLGVNFDNKTFETHIYAKATSESSVSMIHAKGDIARNGALITNPSLSNATLTGILGQQGQAAATLFEQTQMTGSKLVGGVWWQK